MNSFVTYENYNDPHVTIHRADCSQIMKHRGVHKYNQGGYRVHDSLKQAESYGKSTGMSVKHYFYCKPEN